ncbi:MAG: hypothetical protein K1X28_08045 [Parachlamydiales bacterium]|nr:hypothetical protein [Parachlamydiales bacterium]
MICCIPQQGICDIVSIDQLAKGLATFEKNTFFPTASIGIVPQNTLGDAFTNLIDTICASKQPLETIRQFLTVFINQINEQRGSHLSIEDVCITLKQNMGLIPKEYHEVVLLAIDSIEKNTVPSNSQILAASAVIYGYNHPAILLVNWLTTSKKDKKKMKAADPVIIFAIIVAGITLVSIFRPEAVNAAGNAMTEAARVVLGK